MMNLENQTPMNSERPDPRDPNNKDSIPDMNKFTSALCEEIQFKLPIQNQDAKKNKLIQDILLGHESKVENCFFLEFNIDKNHLLANINQELVDSAFHFHINVSAFRNFEGHPPRDSKSLREGLVIHCARKEDHQEYLVENCRLQKLLNRSAL